EILGIVEPSSSVESKLLAAESNLTLKTDYSFCGQTAGHFEPSVRLLPDKSYGTQVNYRLEAPCLLEAGPPLGPGLDLLPGKQLEGLPVWELVNDTSERGRGGPALRKMSPLLAPGPPEGPLIPPQPPGDPATVKAACDQAAECGFEMIILSFGSGLNMEDAS